MKRRETCWFTVAFELVDACQYGGYAETKVTAAGEDDSIASASLVLG